MRVALVNPRWSYEGSIYFGCRAPHLPLELGYARALLEAEGHEVALIDAHAEDDPAVGARVAKAAPELAVVTTAPTYLFWRCPPPELRVPAAAVRAIRGAVAAPVVAVGPHGSTSPETTLAKLGVDAVVRGECEEVIASLARTPQSAWSNVPGVYVAPDRDRDGREADRGATSAGSRAGRAAPTGVSPVAADLAALPALHWRPEELRRHAHHHHRFDVPAPEGLGAEVEASRGCPFTCSFCAKTNHRDRYRRRPLDTIAAELDALLAAGVTYVYFVDELFLPWSELVALLASRPLSFGIQTRIDLWRPEELDALGHAGCVSIEAGIESVSIEGRQALDKRCRLDTFALSERLIRAKATVPFVQATLMDSRFDTPETVARWRDLWKAEGIWVNEPVPLFPYPGSPDYTRLWGAPDERAWERAHDHYLGHFDAFSDIQDERPVRLPILEEAP